MTLQFLRRCLLVMARLSLFYFSLILFNAPIIEIRCSLQDISSQIFDSNVNGVIAAFGDFNSDKLTDLFVITNKGKEVQVFLASDKSPYLRPSTIKCSITDGVITSTAAGDFDGDSQMDVFITIANEQSAIDQEIRFKIFWGALDRLNCSTDTEPIGKIIGQPLILDYNGDKIPDILSETAQQEQKIWLIGKDRTYSTVNFSNDSTSTLFKIPQSHTFIDLNEDMVSDLMLTTTREYELWTNKKGAYVLNGSYSYVEGAKYVGQSTLLDLDLDGKLDHLVPVCYDDKCAHSAILIRHAEKWVNLGVSFQNNKNEWGFVPPVNTSSAFGMNTIVLRVGDYDLDGYPDLLAILQTDGPDTRKAYLLQNSLCATCMFERTFIIIWDSDGLQDVSRVVIAAFYDVFDDGILDILLVRQTNEWNWSMMAFQNNYASNACFIKVIVLSGLCYYDCPNAKVPYGVNQPGPSVCYKTTTPEGEPRASCAGQLSQSAFFSLQLPYVVFGLGHTPNFVDKLSVGVVNLPNKPTLSKEWTSIIPNSQMFVIPNLVNKNRWINKLFVTPSHYILITFAALMGSMGFILFIILGLHWKERREDKKEMLQESNRFHFDAM